MVTREKQIQDHIGDRAQLQLCVVASNQSIKKESQKQDVNAENAKSSSSSSSSSALDKLHVSATIRNAPLDAERSNISLFATKSSHKINDNNNNVSIHTNRNGTGRMRNHSVSAIIAGKGNTGKLTARDINRVIRDPHISTNEAKIESWQRALRAERFLEPSTVDRKIPGRMTAQAFSDKRRMQLESSRLRDDHVHQRPFTSLSVGSSASMRPHSTKPHKEELAQPPPNPPPPPVVSTLSTNASRNESIDEEMNLLYSRCKPRETFSRIGFRPSLEYLQVMERQHTGVNSSSKEDNRRNRMTAYPTESGGGDGGSSSGGGDQGKIKRSLTSSSSSSSKSNACIVRAASSSSYKDSTHGGLKSSAYLTSNEESRPLGTGICLTNLCIEEEDEEEDEHDESSAHVGQAAPMVFSLENPEESTLEVLQLELGRESDDEDAFDETELDLYRIQPRENPVPIM